MHLRLADENLPRLALKGGARCWCRLVDPVHSITSFDDFCPLLFVSATATHFDSDFRISNNTKLNLVVSQCEDEDDVARLSWSCTCIV